MRSGAPIGGDLAAGKVARLVPGQLVYVEVEKPKSDSREIVAIKGDHILIEDDEKRRHPYAGESFSELGIKPGALVTIERTRLRMNRELEILIITKKLEVELRIHSKIFALGLVAAAAWIAVGALTAVVPNGLAHITRLFSWIVPR